MALPKDTTPQDVKRALYVIDCHPADFEGWERKAKFALEFAGRRYPVKSVVALATGVPHDEFSGGPEANGFLMRLGFQVIVLKTGVAYAGRSK